MYFYYLSHLMIGYVGFILAAQCENLAPAATSFIRDIFSFKKKKKIGMVFPVHAKAAASMPQCLNASIFAVFKQFTGVLNHEYFFLHSIAFFL